MRKIILAAALASLAFSASAQNPLVGKWKTLDDNTGKVMTVSEIYETKNGTLAAKIVEAVGVPATCDTCSGEYKNKPTVGIVTLWGLKPNNDGSWGGGKGYKPSEDRHFNAKSVKLVDGGKKLEVKGCVSIICRTATWVRAN